jgi:hypothetical protein
MRKVLEGTVGIIFMPYTNADFWYSGWFTANNASNNDTALKVLKDHIDPGEDHWDLVQRRVQCTTFLFTFSLAHFPAQLYRTLSAPCSWPCPFKHHPNAH